MSIIDEIAPLNKKAIKSNDDDTFPWFDDELAKLNGQKNKAYKASKLDENNSLLRSKFLELKCKERKLNAKKAVEYFETKTSKNLKNSSGFWEFYSRFIPLKNDFSSSCQINLEVNNTIVNNDKDVCEKFNVFFTSISSNSKASKAESCKFIFNTFLKLKRDGTIKTKSFWFEHVDEQLVLHFFKQLPNRCSPGASGIPMKVLKIAIDVLIPHIVHIFNACIDDGSFPDNWKVAFVTPLYKNKGSNKDMNNYRGISVLPILAKLFEKILAFQIFNYFESNDLFFSGQHGFRKHHSCETALHELVSDLNINLDNSLSTMLMFIDFKKAFDTVDSDLLLDKLFHYGFDNTSLKLLRSYFTCRTQRVRLNDSVSNHTPLTLGVPQGSVLGPLFFLIFINDLPYHWECFSVKLFADDTTLYKSHKDFETLLNSFKFDIHTLFEWCELNRIDINFAKTYVMIITN